MPKEKLIKSKERVKNFAEVFTPHRIVSDMLDLLPQEMYSDIFKTFLEPACGTGNFLAQIFGRKLQYCENAADGIFALNSIYGIDIQEDNVIESRNRLKEMYINKFNVSPKTVDEILEKNIVVGDFLRPETVWFLRDNKDLVDYAEQIRSKKKKEKIVKIKYIYYIGELYEN